jgi:hypothetical protein
MSDNRPRLLLHIGLPYTGTDSLRQMIAAARRNSGSTGNPWNLVPKKPTPEWIQMLLSNEGVADEAVPTLVLDDALALADDIDPLATLAGLYECTISVFLIRQDIWLEESYFNHVAKSNDPDPLDKFLQEHECSPWLDYGKLLDRWAAVFGKNNLMIQVLNPSTSRTDAFRKFTRDAGLELDLSNTARFDQGPLVRPWGAEFAELVRLLGVGSYAGFRKRTLLVKLRKMRADASSAHSALDRSATQRVFDRYEQSNKHVVMNYFDSLEPALFSPPGGNEEFADTHIGFDDSAEFTTTYVEPLFSMLARHVVASRAKANRTASNLNERKDRLRNEIERLRQEESALENTISTPRETLRRLRSSLGWN